MSKIWLIFPNTLFDLELFQEAGINPEDYKFHLVEEPLYFGSSDRVEKMNKLKLVLHRASMKYYESFLKSKGYKTKYHEYSSLKGNSGKYNFIKSGTTHAWDPVDRLLESRLGKDVTLHETPNFLLSKKDLEEYRASLGGKKRYFHAEFYEWAKGKLDILVGEKTYDTENRKKFKVGLQIPPLPSNAGDSKWIKEAKQYVQTNFPNNYGEVGNFIFPVTHESSRDWYDKFLEERFKNFGTYQDAMSLSEDFGYHSLIAPMLNVGLLDPDWVLERAETAYKSKKIPINSYEGFVRQIIGWREYSRMLYLFAYEGMKNSNHFRNDRLLTQKWYTGKLGILPVDDTINAAFQNGYLHHILRLMMIANFMNLVGVYPHDVYRWFMEFSCDSYDWVMINNVYSMGLWADGGLTMRKPYISSSNYILKMSDFPKDGRWEVIWKDLFYYWLQKNEEKLKGTPYLRNLVHWKRKSKKEQQEIIQSAELFINEVTTKKFS